MINKPTQKDKQNFINKLNNKKQQFSDTGNTIKKNGKLFTDGVKKDIEDYKNINFKKLPKVFYIYLSIGLICLFGVIFLLKFVLNF